MSRLFSLIFRCVLLPFVGRDTAIGTDQADVRANYDDTAQWVNARGKPIGSKRTRSKRLDRRRARQTLQNERMLRRTAKF